MTAPLEMLRRVTRDMAVTPELPVLLNSIASALAEHTGASFVRVFLTIAMSIRNFRKELT